MTEISTCPSDANFEVITISDDDSLEETVVTISDDSMEETDAVVPGLNSKLYISYLRQKLLCVMYA